jgi:hypothetical protein
MVSNSGLNTLVFLIQVTGVVICSGLDCLGSLPSPD